MILIIDNYDSFTYNLFQQVGYLGEECLVVKNDEISVAQIGRMKPAKIIISPGPGRPCDSGISTAVIRKFYKKIPILGVCLGHECIGEIFGSEIGHAKRILHGATSRIHHEKIGIFKGIRNPFMAARYHSLIVKSVPKDFILTAWDEHKEIMAIQHKKYPLFGVQFHPESFMTKDGDKLMKNFLYEF
jgi:anthranilate synthase/aminodeoxychorismate synthase-like glutamine amidotransferase